MHQNGPIILHSSYSPYLYYYYAIKSFKIYTSTMGPVRIPQEPFSTNIIMENTSVPLLYPLLGSICHFRFFFVLPMTPENLDLKSIRIRMNRINSFWWWSFFLYMIKVVNNIHALLSVAYYSRCHGLLLHPSSFSCSFFCMVMMAT